jgi:hypothetical protein
LTPADALLGPSFILGRDPFEALSRIYPGEYGAEGELELRQVFEPEE